MPSGAERPSYRVHDWEHDRAEHRATASQRPGRVPAGPIERIARALGPLLVFATLLGAGGRVCAQAPAEREQAVQLRAALGPSYLTAAQSLPASAEDSAHGFGVGFNVALGAMVSDGLALNMDLVLLRSSDAEHGVLDDTTFSALHLGAGVSYWLTPANVYLAASLGVARSNVSGNPVRLGVELPTGDASDLGAGLHLSAGKQWAITGDFGLGASLSLLASVANNPVAGYDSPRWLFGSMLALSASLR